MSAEKRALRAAIERARRAIPAQARVGASAQVTRQIRASGEFAAARRIAAYAALPDEVDLDGLLAAVLASGRVLLLPRVSGDAFVFRRVDSLARLEPGAFGVREPSVACPEEWPGAGDLVLVPGIAFDRAGGRLGRGGGFYDRGLARVDRRAVVFGVCFALQIVDRVPREIHDQGVDGVFCEEGLVAPSSGDRPLDPG